MASISREPVVIFQGSKFFWRTRNTVDVTIIEHQALKMTEIVCYEPSIDLESSRVYLDSVILSGRVDHAQIEEKMSFAKRNNVPLTEKFVSDVAHQATADYILNRLFQTEFSVDSKNFEIAFQLNFRDVVIEASDNNKERLIRERPFELAPFDTFHHRIYTECEKDEAMKALEEARLNLHEHCLTAMALQATPELPLGTKERWRIPIVLGKLAHNRCLSGEDSKIWDAVASNLKTQEDIDRVTHVTLRTVAPQPEPVKAKAKVEPAPKVLTGFGRFFSPLKRMISSAPAPSQPAPSVRSPCATPRSSRRMMADTASSQRRALSCAEDSVHKKKGTGTKKKTSVRRPASRQRSTRSAGADASHDHSESSVTPRAQTPSTAAPLAATSDDEAASFINQLVAGLTFVLSSERNKVHALPSEANSFSTQALFSQRGSVKNDRAALTRTHTQDSAEVSMERRHLGALNPHLLATASTSPSLKAEYKYLGTEKSLCGAGFLERSATAEISGKNSVYDECTPQPRKRRSYMGSFLATLTGKVDENAFDSSAKWSVKHHPSRRAGVMGFDWLLGGHGQPVVPVDMGEYQ